MLGVKVGELLTKYAESIDFCAPLIAFEDAEANLPGIMAKRGIGPAELSLGLDAVRHLEEDILDDVTDPIRAEALQRIGRRDPDDWPIVAAALALDCPIWTEDKDFLALASRPGLATSRGASLLSEAPRL